MRRTNAAGRKSPSLTPGQQEQMGRMRSKSMTRFRSGRFFDILGKYVMASLCLSWAAASPAAMLLFCLYRQFCACSWHRLTPLWWSAELQAVMMMSPARARELSKYSSILWQYSQSRGWVIKPLVHVERIPRQWICREKESVCAHVRPLVVID